MSPWQKRYEQMGGDIQMFKLNRCIRVNTKKISAEDLKVRLEAKNVELEKVSFLENAFFVINSRFNLVSSPEYLSGLFYIQAAAAQVPVEVLKPEGLVLDAFAAPGGKTTQLAEACDVVAVDNKRERFEALQNNLERLGVDNCIAYLMDFRAVKKSFKYILLDVPCSGNYMLDKLWIRKNTMKRVLERAEKQKEYIAHAISLLEKDGVLVYSTCSLEPEENEFVIQYALENFDVKLEKVESIGDQGLTKVFGKNMDPSMKLCKRFWPHKTKTIGFFVARLRKC